MSDDTYKGKDTADDFLAHYGILGMKWGVRRSQRELNRIAGRPERYVTRKRHAKAVSSAQANVKKKKQRLSDKIAKKVDKKIDAKLERGRTPKQDRILKKTDAIVKKREEKKKVKMKKKNAVKKMSDQELREVINRMNMEKQYAQLTQTEKNKGIKMAQDIVEQVGKQVAAQYLAKYVKGVIDTQLEKED